MKPAFEARIRWLSPEQGGRVCPPAGPRYSTVVHFEEDTVHWPHRAWSLVVDWDDPDSAAWEMTAAVWLLFYDHPDAPSHFFHAGSRFELMEGGQAVAQGQILGARTA